MQAVIPLGYRFEPTDAEMITYLQESIQNIPPNAHRQPIIRSSAYAGNPDQLARDNPSVESAALNRNWYFFGSRSHRKRKAGDGYWKITSREKEVRLNNIGPVLGFKADLKFFVGHNKKVGQPTQWLLKEYRLDEQGEANGAANRVEVDVLCRLYNKNGDVNNLQEVVVAMNDAEQDLGENNEQNDDNAQQGAEENIQQVDDNEDMEVEENNNQEDEVVDVDLQREMEDTQLTLGYRYM